MTNTRATAGHPTREFVRCQSCLIAAALLLPCAATGAAQLQVPAQYPTIQAAILASQTGDDVIVAPGVYHEAIDFHFRGIRVRSSDGPEQTTIDATGLNRTTVTCNGLFPVGGTLEGFTVTGGSGTDLNGALVGGGVYVAGTKGVPVRLSHCVITGNTAAKGAGVYFHYSSTIEIDHCTFKGLSAASGSAILSHADTVITDSVFRNNVGGPTGDGGIVNFNGLIDITMNNCEVNDNNAVHDTVVDARVLTGTFENCRFSGNLGYLGGTVAVVGNLNHPASGTFADCTFVHNTCAQGGAVNVNHQGAATFTHCDFQSNHAVQQAGAAAYGGAIFALNTAIGLSVSDCLFIANDALDSGGTVYPTFNGPVDITRCTFAANHAAINGGALRRNHGSTSITQCTFATNTAGGAGGAINLTDSDTEISDTLFCGNMPDDIAGTWTDLGGLTFHRQCDTPPGDITGDGVVDVDDLLAIISGWGPCPVPPASCPPDIAPPPNGDGVVNVDDLLLVIVNWG